VFLIVLLICTCFICIVSITIYYKNSSNTIPSFFAVAVIAVKPHPLPYLAALLPRDQDLDNLDTSDNKDWYSRAASAIGLDTNMEAPDIKQELGEASGAIPGQDSAELDAIDNPYLRPVRMPKR
jgi:hypothetical protein